MQDTPFDVNYLLNLFMFTSKRIWRLVKDGPVLSDDTPYIEHPLVTWWIDPAKLDTKMLFRMKKDDIQEYLVSAEK